MFLDPRRTGVTASPAVRTPPASRSAEPDTGNVGDRLAADYSIDDYYAKSIWPIRMIERMRLGIIRDFVGNADGLRILEVGSGGGHVLRMFPRSRLTALDVSERFLDNARRNLSGYDAAFVLGEVDKLDLGDGSFDRVICTEVLEHTQEPEAILGAIARLLAPGVRAVVTVPNDPLIGRLKSLVRHTPAGWLLGDRIEWGGDRYHIHRWTPSEFERQLGRSLTVERRKCAPSDLVPVRACFLCRRP